MVRSEHLERLVRARQYATTGAGKRIREGANLTGRELAVDVGVSHTTLLRWEEGESRPRGESAVRWAQLLDELQELEAAS